MSGSSAQVQSPAILKNNKGAENIGTSDGRTVQEYISASDARVVETYAELDAVPAQDTGNLLVVTAGGISGEFVVKDGVHVANVGIIRDFNNAIGDQYLERTNVNDISVKWFGAVGDGVTDDTVAIQLAVNSNLGSKVYIPQGNYKITASILQNTVGMGDVSVCQFIGDGMHQTVIDNQSGAAAFKVTSGTAAEFAYNLEISNLAIDSTANTVGTIGIELLGCRFVKLEHLLIKNMGSHGLFGESTVGDLTDTAHVNAVQVQIQNCGGYGIYAKTEGNAIQYNWNFYECRVGGCALGGALLESITNAEFRYCGIFYNDNFGLRVVTGTGGAPASKIINIESCEFDTNEGVQIDIFQANAVRIDKAYLIDNNLTPAFTKGIVIGAGVNSALITQVNPRMNPAVSGKVVVEVSSGAVDVVIRDSVYTGWSGSNGNYYVDNTASEVTIDDRTNRSRYFSGTYTAEIKNSGLTVTSPTTVTAYYTVNGDNVFVSLRNFNNIVLSDFSGSDIIGFSLPFQCISAGVGFCGSCVITSDSGTGVPVIIVENGGTLATFVRDGTGSYLTASQLTTGVSDIRVASISYIKE